MISHLDTDNFHSDILWDGLNMDADLVYDSILDIDKDVVADLSFFDYAIVISEDFTKKDKKILEKINSAIWKWKISLYRKNWVYSLDTNNIGVRVWLFVDWNIFLEEHSEFLFNLLDTDSKDKIEEFDAKLELKRKKIEKEKAKQSMFQYKIRIFEYAISDFWLNVKIQDGKLSDESVLSIFDKDGYTCDILVSDIYLTGSSYYENNIFSLKKANKENRCYKILFDHNNLILSKISSSTIMLDIWLNHFMLDIFSSVDYSDIYDKIMSMNWLDFNLIWNYLDAKYSWYHSLYSRYGKNFFSFEWISCEYSGFKIIEISWNWMFVDLDKKGYNNISKKEFIKLLEVVYVLWSEKLLWERLSNYEWSEVSYKKNWDKIIRTYFVGEYLYSFWDLTSIDVSWLPDFIVDQLLVSLNIWRSNVVDITRWAHEIAEEDGQDFFDFIDYCKKNPVSIVVWNIVLDFSKPYKIISFVRWVVNLQQKWKKSWNSDWSDWGRVLEQYKYDCNEYINLSDNFEKVFVVRDSKKDWNGAFWKYSKSYISNVEKRYNNVTYFGNYGEWVLDESVSVKEEISPVEIINDLESYLISEQKKMDNDPNYMPKKCLFDLWLHGWEDWSASFSISMFSASDFKRIFELASKYFFLTVRIDSCFSWYKTDRDLEWNIVLSSSDQVSNNYLEKVFLDWYNKWINGDYLADINSDKSVSFYEATFYSAASYNYSLVPISYVNSLWETVELCWVE